MNKLLSIITLFIVLPLVMFGQEQQTDDFRFIEAGIGTSHGLSTRGAFNVALANSLSNNIANFIDYNMAFNSSGAQYHEINFKLGPYFRFNRYSYIAVSTGMSFIFNSKPESKYSYDNYYHYSTQTYNEEDFLLSIPIQGKLNIAVYNGCCIGLKVTYNKMIDTDAKDKTTILMFLAMEF